MNAPTASQRLHIPGTHGVIAADLWQSQAPRDADTLLMFLHGGAFMVRELDALAPLVERLNNASQGVAVLALHYTLPHIRPFPAALEDVHDALHWAVKAHRQLGWSGRTLALGGVEAGGNLAAAAALVNRDRRGPALAVQVLLTPMLDPALSSASMRAAGQDEGALRCVHAYRAYLPHAVERMHPYASPLASSRLAGLPPALVVSTDGDPLRDEADAYARRLAQADVATRSIRLRAPVHGGFARAVLSDPATADAILRFLAAPLAD